MSILPPGSMLTFTDSVTSTAPVVAVNSIIYETARSPFRRMEYSHKRLLEAPNEDGSMAMIQMLLGNRQINLFTNCNVNELARDFTPDDSVYDSIYKRFDTKRYRIVGATSLAAEIDKLFTIAKNHSVILAQLDAMLAEPSAFVSIVFLTTLQTALSTFLSTYITTTGLQMSGKALGTYSPESNLLITKFSPDVTYEIPLNSAGTSSKVLRTWTMEVESRVLVAERSNSY